MTVVAVLMIIMKINDRKKITKMIMMVTTITQQQKTIITIMMMTMINLFCTVHNPHSVLRCTSKLLIPTSHQEFLIYNHSSMLEW